MYIVPIILIANFCLGIYQNLSVWYKVTDKTKICSLHFCIWCILNFIYKFFNDSKVWFFWFRDCHFSGIFFNDDIILPHWQKILSNSLQYDEIIFYFIISVLLSLVSFYGFRNNLQIGILCVLIMNLVIFTLEKKRIYELFTILR